MGRYTEMNKWEFGVVGTKRQIDTGITAVLGTWLDGYAMHGWING